MHTQSDILLSVDAVVFGYNPQEGISVLLISRRFPPHQGKWALPGGFVKPEESLEDAVHRELKEETGISIHYLEQLYTFGKPERDPRKRVVSVAYYGLVRPEQFELHADTDAADAEWFTISEVPKLAFDHQEIMEMALQRLKGKIIYQPVGFGLLDEKFTFAELQNLYEQLLERRIDRGNFRKRIRNLDILEELDEWKKPEGSGRPARMFRFNERKYRELAEKGIDFELW
ncbi:NUDIX domain-containing protein [Pontibacter sp. G13]|uniref:NUDIX hydrolase n=1 Tax=Pontibacter sp. G13 TaxID=3074898 RepID=UPI00288978BB|nr:NUDIX domain-containing protein [Pontibacter sp. G13]WNJ18931.1 NUDIX domain-containing protein [Pontibacter sp. G13]